MITSILLHSIVKYIQRLNPINIKKFRLNTHDNFSLVIRCQEKVINIILDPYRGIFLPLQYLPSSRRISSKYHFIKNILDNSLVTSIEQPEMERIIIFSIKNKGKEYKFIAELFGGGNMILTDKDEKIIFIDRALDVKDRTLSVGRNYKPPPPKGVSIESLEKFLEKSFNYKEVFKLLPFDKYTIREILFQSGYSQDEHTIKFRRLSETLNKIIEEAAKGEIYCIAKADDDVVLMPFEPALLKQIDCSNDLIKIASRYYYLHLAPSFLEKNKDKTLFIEKKLSILKDEYNKIVAQINDLENLIPTIYSHYGEIYLLFDKINKGRVDEEKILSIDKKSKRVTLKIDDKTFSLKYSISLNAAINELYERLKRLKRGKQQLEKKIIDLENQVMIEKEKQRESKLPYIEEVWISTRKKKWFERYRWFITSENLLVIGGKDARTNEAIIKKHLDKNDIIFHSDVYGSPFVILKEGSAASKISLQETAVFTASYSRAWREGFSSIDVYWIRYHQLSKTAPSGEYLKTGAFMIYGKKNFLRNIKLELFIGLYYMDEYPIIYIAPETSVIKYCEDNLLIKINPGNLDKSKCVKDIYEHVIKYLKRPLSRIDKQYILNEINSKLPPGKLEYKILK